LKSRENESSEARAAAVLEDVLGRIHFREFKILLKPEGFGELESAVRDYWRIARAAARQSSAVVSESRRAGEPQLREVVFLDTPNAGLYAHGYTLRRRAPYVHGRPGPQFELVLEFRHADAVQAASVEVRAAPQYEGLEKFKEEVLLTADPVAGVRSVFSHACRLKEHRWELGSRYSDAVRMFPGLGDLRVLPTAALRAVGDQVLEEVRFALGSIDFGGRSAEVQLSVWRDAQSGTVQVGEFSFEMPCRRHGKLEPQPKLRAERFHRLLQKESGDRVDLGSTRVARVYALAGKKVATAE
jgi:hypothetical protein